MSGIVGYSDVVPQSMMAEGVSETGLPTFFNLETHLNLNKLVLDIQYGFHCPVCRFEHFQIDSVPLIVLKKVSHEHCGKILGQTATRVISLLYMSWELSPCAKHCKPL